MTETKQLNPYYYNQSTRNWYWYHVYKAISNMNLFFESYKKPNINKYYLKLIEVKDKLLIKLQKWYEKVYYTLQSWNGTLKYIYKVKVKCVWKIKLKNFFHKVKCRIKTIKLRLMERSRNPEHIKLYYNVSR